MKLDKGFTLTEIMVVVAIIVLTSSIVLANYRQGEKQFSLLRSAHKLAQDLRTAQAMAMSSNKFDGVFPKGGYGIRFQQASSSYILFADCNDNGLFDESGAVLDCASANGISTYPEKVKEIFLEKKIKISSVSGSGGILTISFFPPDPIIAFKPLSSPPADSASIILSMEDKFVTVSINSVGLIEIK